MHEEASGPPLADLGGLASHAEGVIVADRATPALRMLHWPVRDTFLDIAHTVPLAKSVGEAVSVSLKPDGVLALCSNTQIWIGTKPFVCMRLQAEVAGNTGILRNIQWVGERLVGVTSTPGKVLATGSALHWNWELAVVEKEYEAFLCTEFQGQMILIGRMGGKWLTVAEDGAVSVASISPGMEPIGFVRLPDWYALLCERQDSFEQEILVCEWGTGNVLTRSQIP